MNRATVRLYAELNDPLPRGARQKWLERDFPPGACLGDLLCDLGVPLGEVDLVLVDGRPASLADPVPDGARVSAYPVFERFDIGAVTRVRERPLRAPRFAAAPDLWRLALALRLLGFEARTAPADGTPAPGPGGEIWLTCDPAAPARLDAARAIVMAERRAARQAREVVRSLQLERVAGLARLCPRCGAVETGPRCSGCGRAARGSCLASRVAPCVRAGTRAV